MLTIEKLIGLMVLLSALAVGYSTMHHDLPLGVMVVLGQIHGMITHHNHSAGEEAGHLVAHQKI